MEREYEYSIFFDAHLNMFSINGIVENIQFREYGDPEEEKELVEFNIRRLKQTPLRLVSFNRSVCHALKSKGIEEKDYIQASFRIEGKEFNKKIYTDLICENVIMLRPDRNKKNFKGFEIPGTLGYEHFDGVLVGGSLSDQVQAAKKRKQALEEGDTSEEDDR